MSLRYVRRKIGRKYTFITIHWGFLKCYNSDTVLHAAGMEQQSSRRRLNVTNQRDNINDVIVKFG